MTWTGVQPVEVTSPFRVASITKTLAAVVILQLVEEGRISLGDEVLARLTDDFLVGEFATLLEGATVGDLLAHTSGLPDSARSSELAGGRILRRHQTRERTAGHEYPRRVTRQRGAMAHLYRPMGTS